jgi:hypothetical protein
MLLLLIMEKARSLVELVFRTRYWAVSTTTRLLTSIIGGLLDASSKATGSLIAPESEFQCRYV